MYTRKDFKLFAGLIQKSRIDGKYHQDKASSPHHQWESALDMVTERMCNLFVADNPRFDVDRFEEACKCPENLTTAEIK